MVENVDSTGMNEDAAPMLAPPIDLTQFREITGGSAELEHAILVDFRDSLRPDEEALRTALANSDAAALARCAHRIKGAGRVIAAQELVAACEAIEAAAKDPAQFAAGIDLAPFDRAVAGMRIWLTRRLADTAPAT